MLSMVLDQVMTVQQSVDQPTRFLFIMASTCVEDDPPDYKLRYLIHQGTFTDVNI